MAGPTRAQRRYGGSDLEGQPADSNPYTQGMDDIERQNFYTMKSMGGGKAYSDDEARESATNPRGRLPKVKSPDTKTPIRAKESNKPATPMS